MTVRTSADDGQGGVAAASMTLLIVGNVAPFISPNANPLAVRFGGTTDLTAATSDPNGDIISASWTTSASSLSAPVGNQVTLTAPADGGCLTVTLLPTTAAAAGPPPRSPSCSSRATCRP